MRRRGTVAALCATTVLLGGCGSESRPDAETDRTAEESFTDKGSGGTTDGHPDGDDDGDGADGGDSAGGDNGEGDEAIGALPDEYTFTPNPDRLPTTAAQARELTSGAQLAPEIWWPGLAEDDPHEVAGTWTVLGDDCVWSRQRLPETVLDSLTRRYLLPATDTLGEAQATVTVSAHRSDADAEAEMDATLQESFRCPEQDLGTGARLSGLMSLEYPADEVLNADASLFEMGQWTGADGVESHQYLWVKSRIGPVTAAVSVRGGSGHDTNELTRMAAEGLARVLYAIELELT
ncbi:hypothetical protein RM844_14300 [Streptomyces sp. DSM 44915]|uniref:Lipoprotein n=1 Tax=Streptomyces chisholmiae TaxID=3075540 RepID=A0ABU2JRW3_9ACTN|nr:hypothetical protein [Streptomyces sp. DSM 44915]